MTAEQEVILWLRSPDGERWSHNRIEDRLAYHRIGSGAFADVIPEQPGKADARWTPDAGWTHP
jgi:hypothetical protein